jgi:hypothetical protein
VEKQEDVGTADVGASTIDAPSSAPARHDIHVGNLGEPIRLAGVNLGGVCAEAARAQGEVKVWQRLAITSDDLFFHRIVENLGGVLARYAERAGKLINIARADSVLLVAKPDESAELWINTAAVSLEVIIRRDIEAGSPVFERDIADVMGMNFPLVDIKPGDRVLYLFRQDWRFGLFFDFQGLDAVEDLSRVLGTLYRGLKYRHLYDVVANQPLFDRLTAAGWFPFVEIIAAEFRKLFLACEAGFELDDVEREVIASFDHARLDQMFARWTAKPHFKPKEAILKSAIDAFKRDDPVAVLKIALTEIEGILSEAHFRMTGARAKLPMLLKFAVDSAEQKVGGSDTLLFPAAFAKYLQAHTFANFDPVSASGTAGSRHAVGHGAAAAETYTRTKALQALLILDQFALYT